MTSEPTEAYVWVWLPGATEPVVAGRLTARGTLIDFVYGKSYLRRTEAVPLYLPELPLVRDRITPADNLEMPGCIDDAGPDAWGKRVVMHKLLGSARRDTDPLSLTALTYLLESGTDRIGALDFQRDPSEYVPRLSGGTLDELLGAADRLQAGERFIPGLDDVLLGGSSIGGARPKALITDSGGHLIAKFSAPTDQFPVVAAEAVAMILARRVGLDVASVSQVEVLDREVLLVERFDRTPVPGERRMVVSALTMLGLHEMEGRYASYARLAELVAERFTSPAATLAELFARIVFNVAVGNTDDHARNHAAFYDGAADTLTLTPAYDICPQQRSGEVAAQAMEIGNGARASQFSVCVDAAGIYGLTAGEARAVIERQVEVIRSEWDDACEEAHLTDAQRDLLWGRQVLNPFAFYGLH